MKKETLISLHSHSVYSYHDALTTTKDLIEYAKLYNAPSIGISDHHNLCAWPEFYKACKKESIRPIASVEFYFQWQDKIASEKQSYHLLVTVLNEQGWRNILKLTYLSNLTPDQGGGFYGRPRISEKMLFANQEGLCVSSACVSGPVAKPLLSGNDMEARMAAEEFRDNLKNFYIEIMPHNLPIQAKVNAKLLQIGKDLGIPVITTLDIHFKDKSYENAYICNGDMRRNVTSIERANPDLDCLRDPDFYYKSLPEIYSIFDNHGCCRKDIEESIRNTNVIDSMCTFDWERNHFDQPSFCDNADETLRQLTWKKLKEKFGGQANIPSAYIDRIKVEYNVVKDMGFSNYFLILNDAIDFCNGNSILVGPGRGSAASSLLLWTLGITALDPLLYNLPFERFLNKDRVDTFPDVDVDLDSKGRETLLAYLKSKWGEDKVVQLINFSSMKPKAAIKDVGKWLQVGGHDYFKVVNEITTQIPAKTYDEDGNAVEMEFDEVVKLPQMQKYKHDYPQLFEIASKLIGSYRQPGIHAGAMCILPENAQEIIPTMRRDGRLISQWDKKMSELVGIHKYDFLGLSTLMILDECERMTGIKCGDISLEDKKTWKFLQEAKYMLGIFQFAKDKTKGFLRKIKPTCLQDLSDINTIIRPGADAELYIENRNSGLTTYKFGYPEVIESLKNSYGSIIYQEDIMYLVHRLAGFTLGEGDMLRRALEKNKKADIDVWRTRFKEACKYPDKADELFDWIGANAAYLFNRSHALTYSLIGYWCIGGNSEINLFNGEKKKIQDVIVGDILASVDEKTGDIVANKCIASVHTGVKKVYKVKTKSGKELVCTGDHKILTKDGYKKLNQLSVGDSIKTIN